MLTVPAMKMHLFLFRVLFGFCCNHTAWNRVSQTLAITLPVNHVKPRSTQTQLKWLQLRIFTIQQDGTPILLDDRFPQPISLISAQIPLRSLKLSKSIFKHHFNIHHTPDTSLLPSLLLLYHLWGPCLFFFQMSCPNMPLIH